MNSPSARIKPRSIQIATYLMWFALSLEAILAVVGYKWGTSDHAGHLVILALGMGWVAIGAWATIYLGRGRNWARVALAILVALDFLGLAFGFAAVFSVSALIAGLSTAQVLAKGAALYLAYSPPGSSYFVRDPEDDRVIRAMLPVGRSGWAIAAGYLALFSVLLFPAPFALICGLVAIRQIRRNPQKHGMGRAVFGVIMGGLGTAALVFVIGLGMSRRQQASIPPLPDPAHYSSPGIALHPRA